MNSAQHHLLQLLVDLLEHRVRLEALQSFAGTGEHGVDMPSVTETSPTTQGPKTLVQGGAKVQSQTRVAG